MGKKSLIKGKVGERELASELQSLFNVYARRGQQFHGGSDSPDVVADIPGVHIEVKRTERLSIYKAMRQASGDAGGKIPIVFHRQNREEWLAIIRLNDLPELVDSLSAIKGTQECPPVTDDGN